ncbi:hypothetical protein F5Y08DRAFT_341190 [Xylaria arbuscula]|nr:hypothetical protein F5Y08DRAFT_341190 [Xylaria arbuscula]
MPKQTDITKLLRDQSPDYHALPRHPPVPHFENDEVHNYDVNRRHAYPNNPNANLGDEPAQRDYNEYKQHNITANKSAAEYWRDYINTAGSETKDLPSLNKNQHRALLGSASQAAADTNITSMTIPTLIRILKSDEHTKDVQKSLASERTCIKIASSVIINAQVQMRFQAPDHIPR